LREANGGPRAADGGDIALESSRQSQFARATERQPEATFDRSHDFALQNPVATRLRRHGRRLRSGRHDARARVLLAGDFSFLGEFDKAKREADLAMLLRPDDSMILYNVACIFCIMENRTDAMIALKKAWDSGYRDAIWVRQDPDMALLHGDPEFERLFPRAS
jgi:hypothetical protein